MFRGCLELHAYSARLWVVGGKFTLDRTRGVKVCLREARFPLGQILSASITCFDLPQQPQADKDESGDEEPDDEEGVVKKREEEVEYEGG